MDQLDGMRTYVRTVDAGTLTAAARHLRLSTAAVSRQVAALEKRLGVELLRRTTRRLALTEAGASYYHACRRILADIDEAEDETAGLHGEPRGTLLVNGPSTFGQRYLAPLLPGFLAHNPDLHVELRLDDRLVDLFEEGIDLLVRAGSVPDSTSLVAQRLVEHPRVVCASPKYLSTMSAPSRPEDLSRHECILLTRLPTPDRWTLQRRGETVTVHTHGRLTTNSGEAMRQAALGHGGVILAPSWLVAEDVRCGGLQVILPEWTGPIAPVHALYAKHRSASAKVRALVVHLKREWQRRADWFV
jgi:DNA-binding transcriptional LysR family regulator